MFEDARRSRLNLRAEFARRAETDRHVVFGGGPRSIAARCSPA